MALTLIATLSYEQGNADGSQQQALRWEQAECLRDNAISYIEFNSFPSILFVDYCPHNLNPTPSQLAKNSQNSALELSGLPRLVAGPKIPIDPRSAVVVLTRDQLLCLRKDFASVAKLETTILSDGQEIDVAVLDFSACQP